MRRKLSFFGHTIRDGGCELVKCVIQEKVSGEGRRGENKMSYNSKITKWLSEWNKSRGSRAIARDGEDWRDVWNGRLLLTPDGTAKE